MPLEFSFLFRLRVVLLTAPTILVNAHFEKYCNSTHHIPFILLANQKRSVLLLADFQVWRIFSAFATPERCLALIYALSKCSRNCSKCISKGTVSLGTRFYARFYQIKSVRFEERKMVFNLLKSNS
jgi:hypothetical protein